MPPPPTVNSNSRFCLIGLAPYTFNYWIDKTRHFFEQLYYLPILKPEQMEYHGTERGDFLEKLFKRNYKAWFNFFLKATSQQEFDLNDIDGARNWRQVNTKMTVKTYINAAEKFSAYKTKVHLETIEKNIEIFKHYIALCRRHNLEPIAFLLPFSEASKRHYPQNAMQDFLAIINSFKDDIYFLNLWNKNFPDSCFRDDTHLKMKGGIECTKIIKSCIEKLFNR